VELHTNGHAPSQFLAGRETASHLYASTSAFCWKQPPPLEDAVVGHAAETMGFPHSHPFLHESK
jgi:hypothetical protein